MAQGVSLAPGLSLVGNSSARVVLAAGANNNLAPASFNSGTGRLELNSTAGVANITGLMAGFDGQRVILRNIGANTVTLNLLNAGSAAANQFNGVADTAIAANQAIEIMYYGETILKWIIVN